MNDQLEVQLSTLREAGEQLLHSALQISDSVASIRAVLRELTALGYEGLPGASSIELTLRTDIDHNLENLRHLKNQLDQTTNAVENAMIAHFPPLGALLNPSPLTLSLRNRRSVQGSVPTPVAFDPNHYVSSVNRGLYQEWASNRDALASQQWHLQTLTATRAELVTDFRALRNRLSNGTGAYGTQASEISHLQAQIHQLDADIVQTRDEIERLQGQSETLAARLERVAPAAGANLGEIRQLEMGESSDALKQYTEGCVNYIIHRIHIPPALARDAHLWNDLAAENPQYGITQGQTPLPGSVLMMEREHSYGDDLYGHVMYVERVDGANVWITDNTHPDPVLLSDLTTETSGANITYLYLPWHTAG